MEPLTLIHFNPRRVLLLSIIVLWLGIYLTRKIRFLNEYNIPAPVTGGLICSIGVALLSAFAGIDIEFDLSLRDMLLLIFFSTIGLSANLRLLVEGGKALILLLALAVIFLAFQNGVGILVARIFEGHPAYGLLAGSVSFAGGHGTGITYGKLFAEQYGLSGAMEVAMACATFGLILGGLVGGPVVKRIITRNELSGPSGAREDLGEKDQKDAGTLVDMNSVINATFVLALCMGSGEMVYLWLKSLGITIPLYLPALFTGIIIVNLADLLKVRRSHQYENAVNMWGDVSLTLFLSMSLMSMKILTLQDALRPIMAVLFLQVAVMALFGYLVVYRAMGRDYDAAVITAGFVGLGLGATPVGIANMRAVTGKFGASAKAFLIVPLLGAFFIDIANALVLQFFMGLPFMG